MASTGLHGPYPLTEEEIDRRVEPNGIGAYALGRTNSNGTFLIYRIGRSDVDLNNRLKDYDGLYNEFKFGFLQTVKTAFEKECELYHNFNPPDNENHPDRPDGTDYSCPNCDVFG